MAAQQDCLWGSGTRNLSSTAVPGIGRITHVSHPHLVCADGVEIWADSAVSYGGQGMSDLLGHVRYRDRTRELRADTARYFSRQARLQAHGSLFVQDTAQGSVIRNGDLVYLRRSSERSQEEMTVWMGPDHVRPHATLRMRAAPDTAGAERPPPDTATADTTGAKRPLSDTATATDTVRAQADTTHAREPVPAGGDTARTLPPPAPDTTPYDVVADTIVLRGSGYFRAMGNVEIHRDSLQAFSEVAEYDQTAGRLLLERRARVEGSSYDLSAERIDIGLPGGAIRDVRARGQAVLVGQDLNLTSPMIHMFLQNGLLDRLVAVPLLRDSTPGTAADSARAARPVAVADNFHLTADSLQVDAPGQELKRIYATGDARGESDARDSLNVPELPLVARRDWVEGDTVVVTFVPVAEDSVADTSSAASSPPPDSAKERFRVDRLVASGDARSLYRLPPRDSAALPGTCPPSVNYVKGVRITLAMNKGEVDSMQVDGPAQGYHLEPAQRCPADTAAGDSARSARDTAAAKTDTAKSRSDTLRAGPPTRTPAHKGGGGGGGPAPQAAAWRSDPRWYRLARRGAR